MRKSVGAPLRNRQSKRTEDEIREYCREQIAHYKVPRYIRFVDDLPVTVTGKPQKFVMREAMVRELGLTSMPTA